MTYFIYNEILVVLHAMTPGTAFPRTVLETHCTLNKNWGHLGCFHYKGLGREAMAEAHRLQENLGGFFRSSERHIDQGDNKN